MKRFIRVFVGVLALFVNAHRAVPVPENWKARGCIQCEGDTIPCFTGSCLNFEPPDCGYKCECPTGKTGVLCEQDKVYINVPVVKETVQVKINPIEGLNLPLFGPQANSDLFNNPPPVVNTNTNTNTKQTAMVNTTTTAKSTTTTTATNATPATTTQSTKTGASKNSSPHGSQATSNSDQSTGASSTSGQSQDSSPNPSSSSSSGSDAASSGGSGSGSATGKKVTSTTTTIDLGSVPSLSDALSLAHFDSPSYQNTSSSSSGNPSTDMISKLQRLYTGDHIGTSSSSTSSGVIPQQSDTNVSGSSFSSSSSSFLPTSSAPEASTPTPQ